MLPNSLSNQQRLKWAQNLTLTMATKTLLASVLTSSRIRLHVPSTPTSSSSNMLCTELKCTHRWHLLPSSSSIGSRLVFVCMPQVPLRVKVRPSLTCYPIQCSHFLLMILASFSCSPPHTPDLPAPPLSLAAVSSTIGVCDMQDSFHLPPGLAPCTAPLDTVGCLGPDLAFSQLQMLGHFQMLRLWSVNICIVLRV